MPPPPPPPKVSSTTARRRPTVAAPTATTSIASQPLPPHKTLPTLASVDNKPVPAVPGAVSASPSTSVKARAALPPHVVAIQHLTRCSIAWSRLAHTLSSSMAPRTVAPSPRDYKAQSRAGAFLSFVGADKRAGKTKSMHATSAAGNKQHASISGDRSTAILSDRLSRACGRAALRLARKQDLRNGTANGGALLISAVDLKRHQQRIRHETVATAMLRRCLCTNCGAPKLVVKKSHKNNGGSARQQNLQPPRRTTSLTASQRRRERRRKLTLYAKKNCSSTSSRCSPYCSRLAGRAARRLPLARRSNVDGGTLPCAATAVVTIAAAVAAKRQRQRRPESNRALA